MLVLSKSTFIHFAVTQFAVFIKSKGDPGDPFIITPPLRSEHSLGQILENTFGTRLTEFIVDAGNLSS